MNNVLIFILSITLTMLATAALIPFLRKKKFGQPIREEGNKDHYKKSGTPTMGGVAFTLVFLLSCILFIKFSVNILFIVLYTLAYGLIGFIDDYAKIAKGDNLGLTEKQKLILQFGVAFILLLLQYFLLDLDISKVNIPLLNVEVNVSIFIIPILMFIVVGTTNATNLTDGLDGLLSSVSIPVFLGIAYLAKDTKLDVATSAIIFAGALIGFLVFNSNPASIFMGDTGSMAIGGAIVAMLISINKPIYLIFIGGIYLLEAVSVLIQTIYYKKYQKRVFLMAPIHHHFELKGYKETKIVAAFTTASVILTLFTILIIR